MAVNPDSHVPIYEQIVEHVCGLIAAGVYRVDEVLPSVRGLATKLRVNPNTIQRAYQELERSGVVQTRKGLGVFVATRATAQKQTEDAIYARFADGIDLGRRTKMRPVHLEAVFRRAMRAPRQSTDATSVGQSRRADQ